MRVGSLFAGIGGFDLAAERVGFEVAWQVEIDDYATKVLEKHWPHVQRYRDIRQINWSTVEPVDLVCGGFPCQPHSLAGRRLAGADERDLWPEVLRCLCALRPRWFVGENVSGLLSSDAGRFFGAILRDLAASGFDAEWDCIPASAVGAPHRRDRVWLIAYPGGREQWRGQQSERRPHRRDTDAAGDGAQGRTADVADALHDGCEERPVSEGQGRPAVSDAARRGAAREDVADTDWSRLERHHVGARSTIKTGVIAANTRAGHLRNGAGWWQSEPDVGRVAHGVPARVDRLRCLGNAIVPQVAEYIFRQIAGAA